jgi:hypothetical protein
VVYPALQPDKGVFMDSVSQYKNAENIVHQIIKNAREWDINRDGEYHKVRVIRKTLNIGPSRGKTYLAASKVFDALQVKKIIP